jgi:hypothetical protein
MMNTADTFDQLGRSGVRLQRLRRARRPPLAKGAQNVCKERTCTEFVLLREAGGALGSRRERSRSLRQASAETSSSTRLR